MNQLVGKKKSFIRAAGILFGGTFLGNAITALALPILSRLYTPADFSVLAVFTSLLSVIAASACLRFDVAVSLPEHDEDAFRLFLIAVVSAFFVSTALLLCVLTGSAWISEKLNQPKLEPYLWLLPFGVMLAATYSALQSWFVRKKDFQLLAVSRVIQSSASAGAQLSLAGLILGPFGLIAGQILNTSAACIGLGFKFVRDLFRNTRFEKISWSSMRTTFRAYEKYPRFSTWEALSNAAAIQLPIVIIGVFASGPEAGYLALAMSILQAPLALFGAAIGQVYLARAPAEHRAGNIEPFTVEILGGLLKAGVGPLIAIGIAAPVTFGILFGESWNRAGILLAWMTPWFVMQFLAAPISMVIHITGHQRLAMVLQLFGLVLRVSAVVAASQWNQSFISEAYSVSGFVFYLIYLILILITIRANFNVILKVLLQRIPYIACWIGSAYTVVHIYSHTFSH